jgi:hypothetical protein
MDTQGDAEAAKYTYHKSSQQDGLPKESQNKDTAKHQREIKRTTGRTLLERRVCDDKKLRR